MYTGGIIRELYENQDILPDGEDKRHHMEWFHPFAWERMESS